MSDCIHYTPEHPDWLQKCAECRDIARIHSGSHQTNYLNSEEDKHVAGRRREDKHAIRGGK